MPRHTWLADLDDLTDDDQTIDLLHDVPPDSRAAARPEKPRKRKKGKGAGRDVSVVTHAPDDADDDAFLDADAEIAEMLEGKAREKRRASISEPFKCRNYRVFIGEPTSGV